jgi:hypothetical protein
LNFLLKIPSVIYSLLNLGKRNKLSRQLDDSQRLVGSGGLGHPSGDAVVLHRLDIAEGRKVQDSGARYAFSQTSWRLPESQPDLRLALSGKYNGSVAIYEHAILKM